MLFVDSNVILDVITADSHWATWSATQLAQALDAGLVLINAIVYAEIVFASDAIEAVDALLPQHLYAYRPIPCEASFLAAMVHADYRQRGGQRTMVLPDFLIGAHALLESTGLLTRDERCYRQAFPGLRLILP